MKTTLWHNPRCSKSRQMLELLRERDIEPEILEYLKNPPAAAEITRVLKLLNCDVKKMMRTGEAIYRELKLANIDDQKQLIEAMNEHPTLIERPILILENAAAIGRPPQDALKILD